MFHMYWCSRNIVWRDGYKGEWTGHSGDRLDATRRSSTLGPSLTDSLSTSKTVHIAHFFTGPHCRQYEIGTSNKNRQGDPVLLRKKGYINMVIWLRRTTTRLHHALNYERDKPLTLQTITQVYRFRPCIRRSSCVGKFNPAIIRERGQFWIDSIWLLAT